MKRHDDPNSETDPVRFLSSKVFRLESQLNGLVGLLAPLVAKQLDSDPETTTEWMLEELEKFYEQSLVDFEDSDAGGAAWLDLRPGPKSVDTSSNSPPDSSQAS